MPSSGVEFGGSGVWNEAMTKNEIADVLAEIGTLMELKAENPFKVRAYTAGARAIESLEKDEFEKLIADGKIQSVKGLTNIVVVVASPNQPTLKIPAGAEILGM